MDFYLRHLLAVVLSLSALAMLPRQASAATITVNSFTQGGPGCTITSAILAAETDSVVDGCAAGSGADVIKIPAGTYTIYQPYEHDFYGNSTAFPYITTDITIEGEYRTEEPLCPTDGRPRAAGCDTILERYAGSFFTFRFFRVQTPAFEIRNLTLKGGDTGSFDGGAIYVQTDGSTPIAITARNVVFENNHAAFGGAIADQNNIYNPGVTFTLEDCVFSGNLAGLGGAISVSPFGDVVLARRSRFADNEANSGGAIYARPNRGAVIVAEDTEFVGNRAVNGSGGAIHSWDVQLTRVRMEGNTAGDGGALDNYDGVATIIDSTFGGNSARRGGAIHAMGRLLVSGSTFMENEATERDGGAIFLDDRTGTSRIANSTFSANRAVDRGGAVYIYGGGLTTNNLTFTYNTSGYGPGLALGWWGGSTVQIANSIAAGNTTTSGLAMDVQVDANELLISLGHNLIGTDVGTRGLFTGPGDQAGTEAAPVDAGLLPLADNGGPTPTHALASPGSPALDAGSPSATGSPDACEPIDQRGQWRPGPPSTACDAGAFEYGIYYTLTLTVNGNGFGSVTAQPVIDDCRVGVCTAILGSGSILRLTAHTSTSSVFTGWSGACTGDSPVCIVTMESAREVTATFTLGGGDTTSTLTSTPNPSQNGEEVTFTVVVAPKPPAVGTPAGTVRFIETTAPMILGEATLDATGTATLKTSSLPQGLRTIQALYLGDGLFSTSTGTTSHTVLGPMAATTTALTSSPNPSVSGAQVMLTATVAALSGAGTPTGSVSFTNTQTNTVLGTAMLMAGGIAALPIGGLAEGVFTFQATYSGDLSFSGSTGTVTQTVEPEASAAIRNGEPESRAQFNAVGMILPGPGHAACTGTLVSPFVVLTAAHCLQDASPDPVFEFSLGPDRIARVTDIRVHPLYESQDGFNLAFDLALLNLDRAAAASWTDFVPATLRADAPGLGVEATAVGFGETSAGAGSGRRTSGALIVNDYIPGEGPTGVIHPQAFLEAIPGNANQMFCPTGAGGPLFYEDQIVGVASFRYVATCAEPGPGYYVTVDHVADWIQTTTADLEAASDERTTTTALTASPIPSTNPVTLTAVVTTLGGTSTPTGSVQFFDATTLRTLGTVALDASGSASIEIDDFAAGDYEIRAVYEGDGSFEPSSVTLPLTVTPPPPAIIEILETIVVSDTVYMLPSQMLSISESIIVSDTVTPLPSAMLSISEEILVADAPALTPQNTPAGPAVVVYPADPVVIEFSTVTAGGETSAVVVTGPPPPSGFRPTTPPVTFDITTTAQFTGPVRVCLAHPPASVSPRLMHFENGAWVDRTTSVNSVASTVCGSVTSLSPFAVFVPLPQEGRMTGHGELAGGHEFDFRVAERSFGDERGALRFERTTPKSGKVKARTDTFRATEIADIWFWDDQAQRPSRRPRPAVDSVVFTGTGKWNGVPGYSFEVEATDEGEPGRGRDTFSIVVRSPQGAIVASSDGVLTGGNIQSQRLRNR